MPNRYTLQTSSDYDANGNKVYRYGYQGSEKDFEITNVTGAHMSTFFREIDTRLGRMWSVDPRANAFENPYMSMGNNPIWRNDVLGDKWKTKSDEKKAADMKGKFKSKRDNYQSKIEKYGAKMAKRMAKGKSIGMKLQNKYSDAVEGRNEMANAMDEVDEMGKSDVLFKFNNVSGKSLFGYTEYDKSDGAIAINFTGDDANTAHEMKHAYQHLTGQVEIVEGGIKFSDLTDEVESYKRQFHFNSFSMPSSSFGTVTKSRDITVQYVKGIYVLMPNGHKNSLYKDFKVRFRFDKSGPHSNENELIRILLQNIK